MIGKRARLKNIARSRAGLHEGPDFHVPLKAKKIAKMENNTLSRGYYLMKDYKNTMNLFKDYHPYGNPHAHGFAGRRTGSSIKGSRGH